MSSPIICSYKKSSTINKIVSYEEIINFDVFTLKCYQQQYFHMVQSSTIIIFRKKSHQPWTERAYIKDELI